MRMKTSGVANALAALSLGLVLAIATLSQRVPEFGGLFAALLPAYAGTAVLLTVMFFRAGGRVIPSLSTHVYQSAVLYVAVLFGWALQAEGLTAPAGKLIVAGAVVMIAGNAATLLVVRRVARQRPNRL